MRIIFLGTGGGLPTPKRNLPATALQIGSEIVLFDCGEGTQRQFMSSNASFMKVQKIFITHFHGDHFLGLPGLIQSMNFIGRKKKLEIYGPPGIVEIVDRVVNLGYFSPGFEISAMELKSGESLHFDGYDVFAVAVDHLVPAFGYVLKEATRPGRFLPEKAKMLGLKEGPLFRALQKGRNVKVDGKLITPEMVTGPPRPGIKIAISGDTRPCDRFAKAAENSDLIIHEATLDSSLREQATDYGHSTAMEAAMIALRARASTLYLNHISNRYEDASILENEARMVFPNTFIAEDLMEITLRHRKE
ncbi:MAG: ribonuclease Z [Methanomassiliicoccales archaeon]|nr:ribonuclease Z [Methanomassiliicoccales archaeon]